MCISALAFASFLCEREEDVMNPFKGLFIFFLRGEITPAQHFAGVVV